MNNKMNNLKEISDKIFLSYHSSKIDIVDHLAKYLERHGLITWYAPRNISSGKQWDESINTALKECKAVVLLFCTEADASIQVKRELALADKYKKPVFWLRIERVEPNNLSYFLTSTQWLDWMDMRDASLEKLVEDIKLTDCKNSMEASSIEIDKNSINEGFNSIQKGWTKGIIAFNSDREAAECVARTYFSLAQMNPDSSLILPTGRSSTMIFRAMRRIANEFDECPFGEAHIITDTETFGVWSEHETSRTRHVKELLIEPLKALKKAPSDEQLCLLSGIYTDSDPVKSAQKTIRMFPPCVHAISTSPVGEVLAYEVGTYNEVDEIVDDMPRIVEVGMHSKKYIDPNQPSRSILSIGLGVSLSVNVLLIPIFDIQKANILSRILNGPMTAGIPATILSMHPNAYIVTTKSIIDEAKINDKIEYDKSPKEAAEWIIQS